ncbi:MAG: hypothetical protein IKM36_03950, partial [Oscillospiraceae bacterium]|nr:hypothetical protein [Oscillospiraceae bacterium]
MDILSKFPKTETVSQTRFSFFLQKEKGFGCPKEKTQAIFRCIRLYPACVICIDFSPKALSVT